MSNNYSNLIPPFNYWKEEITESELEKIFFKNWFFAAMEDDLAENNAYITLNIFNFPIVVQNFRGEIKAFVNICPHRYNKIQTDTCGKRPFVCKYHNWAFDKNGCPNPVSLKQKFDTESEEFKSLKVTALKLVQVGKFIFVADENCTLDIKDYLGSFYDKLLLISDSISNRFYFDDSNQKINWKMVVENVIEAYHCPAIHRNTLYGMGFCSVPEANAEYFNGHSVADYPKDENYQEQNKVLKYLDKRTFNHSSFRHYYIFPNLVISSTEGTSIYVGNILPVAANETILRKRFYNIHFEEGFLPKPTIHNAFLEMVKTSINSILEEDRVVLEEVQKNMKFAKNYYYLGSQEQRLVDFHKKYNSLM